jgi:hypothetical protein
MKAINPYHYLLAGAMLALTSCSGVKYVDTLDSPNGRLVGKACYIRGERYGISPTAGADTLMIRASGVTNSMADYAFDTFIVPGTYYISVDVGNYSDLILAQGTRVRLTAIPDGAARGTIIEPVKFWSKDPARGGIERWVYKFRIPYGSEHVGKRAGATIWVPGMGKPRNISFDDVQISISRSLRSRLFDSKETNDPSPYYQEVPQTGKQWK